MKKFPKRNIGTGSDGVVFFLEKNDLMQYYEITKSIISDVVGMKFFGMRFQGAGRKIIIFVSNKNGFNEELFDLVGAILKEIYISKFKNNANIFLCDYYHIAKNSEMTNDELKNICSKVLKTEDKFVLPPMKKSARSKINIWLAQYKHLKSKTNGQFGYRRITLVYKK